MSKTAQPIMPGEWERIARRNGWSGYGIAKAFCEEAMEPAEIAEEAARIRDDAAYDRNGNLKAG